MPITLPKPRQLLQAPRGELKEKSEEVGLTRGAQLVVKALMVPSPLEIAAVPLPRASACSKDSVSRDLLRVVTLSLS